VPHPIPIKSHDCFVQSLNTGQNSFLISGIDVAMEDCEDAHASHRMTVSISLEPAGCSRRNECG
jgi:hypothetical protein